MPTNTTPTAVPFPTTTAGYTVHGELPPISAAQNDASLSNPATIEALANLPTATPDYAACPPAAGTVAPEDTPTSGHEILREILRFLSAGGTADDLENMLRDEWDILGESGFVQDNVDLTGEGIPEIIVGYSVPDEGGTLLVLGCADGRYAARYQAVSEEAAPPELVWAGDVNHDSYADLVFATQHCADEDSCEYRTQVLAWQREAGRFVNLLAGGVTSFDIPTLNDVDHDEVAEIIVQMDSRGTAATGPLRTGVNIYDWNGTVYTLSITQLDPPRFRIQVVHEADRYFSRLAVEDAIALYELALEDPDLRYWFNDGPVTLADYINYRLLLAYAYTENPLLLEAFERISQAHPDPTNAPIYAEMAFAYWGTLQATSNLHSACVAVQRIVEEEPRALSLLNRYGSHNPTYEAEDLCPF